METQNVTVVIPTWNSARTLKAVIESCLNQTFPPLEILVCDDGSTDESKNIVEAMELSNVHWLAGTHTGGPAGPRNRGLSAAKGEWIAFCDSDDMWQLTKLEKQMALVKKLGQRAVSTNGYKKIDGNVIQKNIVNWEHETLTFDDLLKTNYVICSSAIVHNSLFREIGGFPEDSQYASFEDYIFWLRLATQTNFAFVNEPLVIYDDHPTTSLRATFQSGVLLKKISLANFIAWANSRTQPSIKKYIWTVKVHRTIERMKNILITYARKN